MEDFSTWLDQNKELWVRVYDEVITPKLEIEWKKRNEAHEKELNDRNEAHNIQIAQMESELAATARIKEENSRLKNILQERGIDTSASIGQEEVATSDATITKTNFRRLAERFNELEKRYQESSQTIKYLERKNVAVMQKNKDMKESVRAWQEYYDRKEKRKATVKAVNEDPDASVAPEAPGGRPNLLSSPKSTTMSTPRPFLPLERSSPAPMEPLTSPKPPRYIRNTSEASVGQEMGDLGDVDIALERSEQGSSPLPEDPGQIARAATSDSDGALSRQPGPEKFTSSQTTEDEVAEQNLMISRMNAEDDDDIPEVVSERSLKRKRKPSSGIKIYTDRSDGTPAKPIRVKEEPHSSPPLSIPVLELHRKETMDLDELGQNVIHTPHKRTRRTSIGHMIKSEVLQEKRSGSAPLARIKVKEEPLVMTGSHSENKELSKETELRMSIESENPQGVPVNVLRPLDSNAISRIDESTPNKRLKKDRFGQKGKHRFITETEETPPPTDENGDQLPSHAARSRYNNRLRALKHITTPSKDAVTSPKTAPAKATATHLPTVSTPSTATRQKHTTRSAQDARRRIPAFNDDGPTRPDPIPDGRPVWTLGSKSGPSKKGTPLSTPKTSKTSGPLRSKPVDELGVLDFKPNPAYNQGYTHAFSETVRRRSDRLCLPGCTNTECCGSTFRALASAAAPLTSSQEEDLLQDYLGDAYDSFGLTQMSEAEKKEVVLQARTRQMANKYGKHRQAHERGKSPPGFWRTGFPSTQEVEADKAQAREIEKGMVRERWLEAQRKGGKWIFRDE
ncbi:SAE2-domain-containing protein [Periconia macrospinosa]|uniref:SAE2-domain-containing protein n=1 Tax=Periconia macrospinosa TaxID=97972 RepID=A0A2V1EGI0_9PLEO|nr:SAE2-domain-containing protein [Periconia macrospinosa]